MKSKQKELSWNVVLFAIGTFAPKLLSMLLVPLYTNCLSTSDYGIADLISTTVSLAVPIFTFCMTEAVLRFNLDKNAVTSDIVTAGLDFVLKGAAIIGLVITILCLIPSFPIPAEYLIFGYLNYLTSALYSIFVVVCKSTDKVSSITISAIVNAVVTVSANILFLPVFKWGLRGFFIANLVGNLCACAVIVATSKLYQYVKRYTVSLRPLKKELIVYGMPLIISSVAWWVNNASDRYMVSAIVGTAANGIYAVGYKIPNIFESIQGVFMQAWAISVIKYYDPDDKDGFIGKNYTMLSAVAILSCSALMLGNIFISKLLFAKEFFEAWHYVPILLLSAVVHAFGTFIGQLFLAVKDMKAITTTVAVGTATNIVLNLILIPLFGAMGAAIATLSGYTVIFVIRIIYLRKHIRMQHSKLRDFTALAILTLQMVLALFGMKFFFLQIPIFVLLVILYGKPIIDILKKGSAILIKPKKQA